MNKFYPKNIHEMIKASVDIWHKGWCEGNGGNISLKAQNDIIEFYHVNESDTSGNWIALTESYPELADTFFIISGSGRFLRNIELFPEKNIGLIKLNGKGSHYMKIWGFEGNTKPTSELPAHLSIHAVRKKISHGHDKVVIHVHPPNLIALSYIEELTSEKLSKIIWKMHAEGIVVFPEGIGFLPWLMAGSKEIAVRSQELFKQHRIILWEHHGVLASGRNLDEAFGLIHTAEKLAEIYIKCISAGGIKKELSSRQLGLIARNFNVKPAYKL